MESDNEKAYYGWTDVANYQQAIVFYADMFAQGHHHHEICKMLDGFFPRIDYITLGKIQVKAIDWLRALGSNIETKIYLAKSITRLERICANPHEKTRNVLVADNQLTHLLGLADVQEQSGPEEMAVWIRAFNKAAKEATDGSGYAATEKASEVAKNPEPQKSEPVPKPESEPVPVPKPQQQLQLVPIGDAHLSEEDLKIDISLRGARALRLKIDIDDIDDEIKASNQKHQKQEQDKTSKELQDEIDLSVYD